MHLQMDLNYEEECETSGDDSNILVDEYLVATNQDDLQLGFSSSKPKQNSNPVITIINRSGIHEIGVQWCCCPDAPKRDMQLMVAGLFLALFRNPRMAFTFWMLDKF